MQTEDSQKVIKRFFEALYYLKDMKIIRANRRGRQDRAAKAVTAARRLFQSGKGKRSQSKNCTGLCFYRSLSGKRKASDAEAISETEKKDARVREPFGPYCHAHGAYTVLRTSKNRKADRRVWAE